eukprot:TRINITY_DN3012_c0_g1_i1.p1 TRINITY_DN3012_c0_g1~~TRINITY_DN3012_c0_g1_i1.p1  ORF type:complete len:522 (+),score=64.93 TRINITY_DN3012_c0_g1_i1:38-1603(+)
MKAHLVIVFFLLCFKCSVSLWPMPQSVSNGSDSFTFTQVNFKVSGFYSDILKHGFERFSHRLFRDCGEYVERDTLEVDVRVLSADLELKLGVNESYVLYVDVHGSSIEASTVYGALHALETFFQIVTVKDCVAHVDMAPWNVNDFPRFPHRGIMLDTARNFIPKEYILKLFDGMASTKMNVFHWHTYDSTSFPLGSQKTKLAKGAYSSSEVYSKKDVEEIVKYAKDRGIRVIPEFEMPGHSASWGVAYPQLVSCYWKAPWINYAAEPPSGQLNIVLDETFSVINTLLTEMAEWFPEEYTHMGGDEVNLNCYNEDPVFVKYLKDHNVTLSQVVKSFEEKVINSILQKEGKTPIVWQSIISTYNVTLPSNGIVQLWLDQGFDAVLETGYKVIMSPWKEWYLDCGVGNYLNPITNSWCDPFKTWAHMYSYDPTNNVPPKYISNVLGGEGAMWTEQVDQHTIEQKIWPRALAIAERLWSDKSVADVQAAIPRLENHRDELIALGISPSRLQPQICTNNPGLCYHA